MRIDPTYLKIFAGVASHSFMYELLNLRVDGAPQDLASGAAYAGRWFEILQHSYSTMFDVLPPLLARPDIFALSELKAGNVGSVFFEITIHARRRWFHGYCDLSDRAAPDAMRAAINFWETGDATGLCREQKLDAIWSVTHPDYRGVAGIVTKSWPQQHRSDRTILCYQPGVGTVVTFLDSLTDEEIAARLPRREQR
ncbi:hypothetical protein CAF53_02495 [Sphingobium sp. LB126]|uniref:DUF1419 domain-containing protein n=1 Tax=Sphingobium sp. LB126 TaxID=1983755 RepID=UPI000C20CF51|nr:DUF1419 domain-containing protein [Sphingobium sp. LB126]PJG47234.1 hypothetical protein CAF53_02495 [Sphingobium sp. LB126]